jgi:hypothetical protein
MCGFVRVLIGADAVVRQRPRLGLVGLAVILTRFRAQQLLIF